METIQLTLFEIQILLILSYLKTGSTVLMSHKHEVATPNMYKKNFIGKLFGIIIWPWFVIKNQQFGYFLSVFLGTSIACWIGYLGISLFIDTMLFRWVLVVLLEISPIGSLIGAIVCVPIWILIVKPLGGNERKPQNYD